MQVTLLHVDTEMTSRSSFRQDALRSTAFGGQRAVMDTEWCHVFLPNVQQTANGRRKSSTLDMIPLILLTDLCKKAGQVSPRQQNFHRLSQFKHLQASSSLR